jgi:hypothetical protein
MKSNKELAEEFDTKKDTGHELDGFELVTATVAKNPRHVVSTRLASAELREIEDAAEAIGENVSEFIRSAALERARTRRQANLESFVSAMSGAFQELAGLYNVAGSPYGPTTAGMHRWLEEIAPQRPRRTSARKAR